MSGVEPGPVYRHRASERSTILVNGGQGRWMRVTPVTVNADRHVMRIDADTWMDDAHLKREYELAELVEADHVG